MIQDNMIFSVDYVEIVVEKSVVTGRYFSMITYMFEEKSITFVTNIRSDQSYECAIDTAKSVCQLYPLASKAIITDENGKEIGRIDMTDELKKYSESIGVNMLSRKN